MIKKVLLKIYPDAGKKWALLRCYWNHKSIKPQKVVLQNLKNELYLNWEEPRGRAVILCNALGQPEIKHFWGNAVSSFNPDIVLDCGANYGEIIYHCAYPEKAVIIGIEADKSLMPYLEKSKHSHPNYSQITLYNAFASDKSDTEISFFVDKKWSGRSSGYVTERMKEGELEERKVQTLSIDKLIGQKALGKKLLFKIDVEGYEPFVLKGMAETISCCEEALGIIEFNTSFFEQSGSSVSDFLQELKNSFEISLPDSNLNPSETLAFLKKGGINTDLILTKKKQL